MDLLYHLQSIMSDFIISTMEVISGGIDIDQIEHFAGLVILGGFVCVAMVCIQLFRPSHCVILGIAYSELTTDLVGKKP